MATFNHYPNVIHLNKTIEEKMAAAVNFEQTAQRFTDTVYAEFKDSLVLARVFVTVPYGKLPTDVKGFVDKLAVAKSVANLLHENTLVLSLAGTRGLKLQWNDRKQSQGHVGIPLVSSAFIGAIPMMSRLLGEMGLDLNWIEKGDTAAIEKTMCGLTGVFYVGNAQTDLDNKDRKIIAAQDYVKANNVQTVFGFGSGFPGKHYFMVALFFTKETIDREKVRLFSTMIGPLRSKSVSFMRDGKIFND